MLTQQIVEKVEDNVGSVWMLIDLTKWYNTFDHNFFSWENAKYTVYNAKLLIFWGHSLKMINITLIISTH